MRRARAAAVIGGLAIGLAGLGAAREARGEAAGATAAATTEPAANGRHDLRLRELPAPSPATLAMRAPRRVAASATTTSAAATAPATAADATTTAALDYRPLPTSARDVEERVIARVTAGYQADSAGLSGDAMRTGYDPAAVRDPDGAALRTSRQYLMGDAVLGSRGVLLPSLDTYFLSRFRLDPDRASRFATLNDGYDRRGGSDLIIRAGYAEVDGIRDGALRGLTARAGRLFRGGTGTPLTNFDGAVLGWKTTAVSVDGYVGRRVSLYPVDDPGLVGGAGVAWRGGRVAGVPVEVLGDYAFFGGVDDPSGAAVSRHAIGALARASFGRSRVYLRGRVVDRGDGFGLGRLGVRVRHPLGEKLLLVGDLEQRFAGELAYDLLAPTATDVVEAGRLPALGLEPPLASTLIGLRADYMITRALEAYAFGRADVVPGDGDSSHQNGWQELGGALAATRGALGGSAQIKVRRYGLDDGGNAAGAGFTDTSGSGIARFAELAAEGRYRFGGRAGAGKGKGSAALGAYYRAYALRSAYVEVDGDGRGGARLEADYWPTRIVRVAAAGEIAQPSPTMARELSTMTSVRLIGEARF